MISSTVFMEQLNNYYVSQRWRIPKQTIHGILKDFEKKGLVVLSPMEEDKRSRSVGCRTFSQSRRK